jgi:hypothetical protein
MYIGVLILLLGWIGLLIIGLSFKFDDDEKDKRYLKKSLNAKFKSTSESSSPE